MNERELYELAQQRIDQRNRRWTLWAINLAGLVASLAVMILMGDTALAELTLAVFLTWGGVFTAHTIMLGMAETRQKDVEGEFIKLRDTAKNLSVYEKPKRLELTDDGEVIELRDTDSVETLRNR
jgi:hypothetical protein